MEASRTKGPNREHQCLLGVLLQEYFNALDFSTVAVTRTVGTKKIVFLP